MRLFALLAAAIWGIIALLVYRRSRTPPPEAHLTAAYLLLWPAVVALVYWQGPVPLWLGVPLMVGLIPWLLAGPHLLAVLRDPERADPQELIGIPRAYWTWGLIGALLLGLLFGRYA